MDVRLGRVRYTERMAIGRVIVLNGPSSSGKTSLARAMQAVWHGPLLHIGLDTVIGMLNRLSYRDVVLPPPLDIEIGLSRIFWSAAASSIYRKR